MAPTELAVTVPALVGSTVSFLACTAFAVVYIILPPKWHLRQALIINLLLAGKSTEHL